MPEPARIARHLLAWYDVHARVLPWRYRPGESADPYRVWLSEIMLQQTTVAAVKAYFLRFTTLWPTVADLAAAPIDDVMKEWAGLGYYSRARNLHAAAQMVARDFGGAFPSEEAQLRELPGVGPYTAAAIAAIAFGRATMPVDGNIERVTARLFAEETPLPAAKPILTKLAAGLTPPQRAGDFAQAMMDLGATICTPKSPACALCPLNADCAAYKKGIQATLPRRADKAARPERFGAAFLLFSEDGHVLLRRRPPKGLLGGMLEIPSTPWTNPGPTDPLAHAPVAAEWKRLPTRVEHVFTHFKLTLDVYAARVGSRDPAFGVWTPQSDADAAGLPSVMRKILAASDGEGDHSTRGRRGR
ncbi:Adenine DNA glycosylase [Alphaproteobacteria bacterium SO-S41]|nr:Adenine DNA glycosylase [Alphaproteobacteria bacterium SO-S41]